MYSPFRLGTFSERACIHLFVDQELIIETPISLNWCVNNDRSRRKGYIFCPSRTSFKTLEIAFAIEIAVPMFSSRTVRDHKPMMLMSMQVLSTAFAMALEKPSKVGAP